MLKRAALAGLLVSWNAGTPASGQESSDIFVDISQDSAVTLALPEFKAGNGVSPDAAELVWRTVLDDISFAAVFRIVEPSRVAIAGETSPFDYYGFESIGADVAFTGELSSDGTTLFAHITFHDIQGRLPAWDTDYESPKEASRDLAHYIADSILAKFRLGGIARTKIAFSRKLTDGGRSLFQMDYDGHRQRVLTRNRHLDFQPRFSPDDEILTFISYPTKSRPPVLAVLNGEPLFEGPGMIFSAEWSRDGESIAFSASRDEPGNAEIYVMRRDGSRLRRLTHHPSIDVSPTWSPTGREIAFTSNRGGSPQIYVMDAEGLNVRRVSMKGSYNAEPAWSPLRLTSEIAYASRVAGGNFEIVVHDLEKNEVRFLTSGNGLDESPRWSPNGAHLVFTSTRTGSAQIFTMHRDGSSQRQLTFDGENTTPSWGPEPDPLAGRLSEDGSW